ncbi:MAG: hypothetical protein HY376_03225 [Candidatus Blackburnbacteria bacterium]|nr:hypothetical protein [Candidatus Blackburnbacteria bacterium]
MKNIKVNSLFEEIGTLSEDGTLTIENQGLVVNGSVLISKDIIEKLREGKIVCKKTCDKIRIVIDGSEYETTPNNYILFGSVEVSGDSKLSLPLEKWQQPKQATPFVERTRSFREVLAELKISHLEI